MDLIHGEIRQFEVKFKNDIFKILRNHNILLPFITWEIVQSSDFEDCNLSYDMKFNGNVNLSVRIRRNKYLKFRDFTIRTKSKNGYKCEYDKLIQGCGQVYFYGWMDITETKIIDWIIVDIDKIRNKIEENGKYYDNIDNTGFKAYQIDWLKEHNALIKEIKKPEHNSGLKP
jgi:hypothetical protein